MKFWLLLIVGILSTRNTLSQTFDAVIQGKVLNINGLPLEDVVVHLSPANEVTTTNANGEFIFRKLKPSTYQLSFSQLGFKPQNKTVSVQAGETVSIDLVLQDHEEQLNEVVVTGKTDSRQIMETSYAVQSIEVEKFQNRSADINQVLNAVSGVRIRQSGGMGSDFNFSLNGLSDSRVRFFVDDIPIDYLGDAYKFNNLPVNFVSRIDLYKGVVPVDLGADALGGAVNIISTKSYASYLDASYSYGSFNTHRIVLNGQYRNKKSGLTIRPKAFYNFSNNSYTMRDMQVYVDQQWKSLDVKRFHDDYMSATASLEAGYTYVGWADELLFGYSVSKIENDIQTDIYGNPRGDLTSEETSKTASVRYSKSGLLSDKLSIKLFGVLGHINSVDIDTSSNRYNWLGDVTRVSEDNTGEIMNQKTIFEYDQKMATYRANVHYKLFENHTISANYIGYHVKRQGENRLGVPEEEPFRSPNTLMKNVLGVSYDADLLENKLNINVAAKYYHFNIATKNAKQERDFSIVIEDQEINQNQLGYYFCARYFITPDLYVKSSYEKGYRLPEPNEIFGDGLNRYANPLLAPESSDNINLGINFNRQSGKNRIIPQANFFYRDVQDYMQPVRYRRGSRVENLMSVLVYGFEFDVQYEWNNRLMITANITRQNVLNNEKYDNAGNVKKIYRDKLPNTPYFFGNLGVNYDLLRDKNAMGLSVYYSLNYVNEFFLGYESVATGGEKNVIPTQILHNVGVTIASNNKRYSVTMEGSNIFNALTFDNFNIQRPGRALSVKLRYNINNL